MWSEIKEEDDYNYINIRKNSHLLSLKTQWEASKNNVGTKCHKWNVEVWRIYVINWGFIREPAPYWLSYPCPMALKTRKISEKDVTTIEGKKKGSTRGKQNVNSAYPVQERKQNNLQFVPHIVVIHLEIILGIWEVPTYLFDLCTKYQYKELECIRKNCFCTWQPRIKGTDSRIFITFIQGPWDVHEQWKSQIYFSHIKSKFQNEVEKSKWRPKITWLEVRRSEEGGDCVWSLDGTDGWNMKVAGLE